MSKVPAAIPGKQGILPQLPGAVHVEPGKLRKSGLFAADNSPAVRAYFVLAVSFSRISLSLDPQIASGHLGRLFDSQ